MVKFNRIKLTDLTKVNFGPYGQVFEIQTDKEAEMITERFNFHPKLATFDLTRGNQLQIGISTFLKRPFRLATMERHLTSEEIMIPLDKQGVVIAFAKHNSDDIREIPEIGLVEAFYIPPTKGIVVYKNVWHWTPMPIVDQSSIICCFETGTEKDDVIIKEFSNGGVVEIDLGTILDN